MYVKHWRNTDPTLPVFNIRNDNTSASVHEIPVNIISIE